MMNEKMNGVKYQRLKRDMTREELAAILKVSVVTIAHMEGPKAAHTATKTFVAVAKCFDVPVEDLYKEYDCRSMLIRGNGGGRRAGKEGNCLAGFLEGEHHTLRTLAKMLGCSHETVRTQCNLDSPDQKYVDELAKKTGMTPEAFQSKYGRGKAAAEVNGRGGGIVS